MDENAPSAFPDPATDRRNGNIFILVQLLIYFSAPVLYVGVVQAAFCEKLGASATVANLPQSTYMLGAIAPMVCAFFVPSRREKSVLCFGYAAVSASMALVCAVVFLPAPTWLRITAVIGQGLILGVLNSVNVLYVMRCLARGTTEVGRARALKYAFGLGPVAAVLGSLSAQALLAEKVPGIVYPFNFGLLYLVALPCMAVCAWVARGMDLGVVATEPAESLPNFLRNSVTTFIGDRRLATAWIAYLFWYCTLGGITNLSLYTREAVGRSPLELAGIIMALRFGLKALAGFGLGSVAARFGAFSAMLLTVLFVGLGLGWPFVSSGYGYLLAFGLMGAGELGGVYFSNYVISVSKPANTTRNLAFLSLVGPVSSFSPALHGNLTDRFGFQASFILGITCATCGCLLLLSLRRSRVQTV